MRDAAEMWRLSEEGAARRDEERRKYPDGLPRPVPSDAEILKEIEEAMMRRASSGCSEMQWPPYPAVYGFVDTDMTPDAEVIANRICDTLRALGYKVDLHATDPEPETDENTLEQFPSGDTAYSVLIRWTHGGRPAEGSKG